jgi:hypothetical protein
MPVQVFVDDSGGKGQGRYFIMAGLIAHSDHWAAFSDEWRACLSAHPAIRYFKMRQAAAYSGEFHRFSEMARNEKLRALARIINRYAQIATFSTIDLDAHAETWATKTDKPLNEPYFWPFHNTIMASCFELWDIGWRERFEIVFDDQVIFGPRAKAWYPVVRDALTIREPEASQIMPVDPLFRSDLEFLPIQACDLIAYCNLNDSRTPGQREFAWLDDEITKPYVTEYSQFYDRERMASVLDEAQDHLGKMRAGLRPDWVALAEKYREYFGR